MIISCPQCSSKFAVKAEAIGEKGRNVKCAKCAHKWFQEPNKEELEKLKTQEIQQEPDEVKEVPQGSNLPVVTNSKTPIYAKISLAASILIMAVVITVMGANQILPSMSGYYSLFGIYDSGDIKLYDVEVKKIESGRYNDLLVSAKIVNESKGDKRLPNLRVSIYDNDENLLDEVTLDSEGTPIEAGQAIDFQNTIEKIPASSSKIVMDLGNKIDLMYR